MSTILLAIIISGHNETQVLQPLFDRLCPALGKLNPGHEYETVIIAVLDCIM